VRSKNLEKAVVNGKNPSKGFGMGEKGQNLQIHVRPFHFHGFEYHYYAPNPLYQLAFAA
jgi:hypothetical protein